MDSPLLSPSKLKNATPEVLFQRMKILVALQQFQEKNPDQQQQQQQSAMLSKLAKQYNQKQTRTNDGNDQNENEEHDEDADVVVWRCNDHNDSEDDDDEDEEEGETDYLDLDDADDDDDDETIRNGNQQNQNDFLMLNNHEDKMQDQILQFLRYQCGFLNKRHVLFGCSGIAPDVREVEMWLESALAPNKNSNFIPLEQLLFQRYHGLFLQQEQQQQNQRAVSPSTKMTKRSNTPDPTKTKLCDKKRVPSSTTCIPSLPILISQMTVINYNHTSSASLLSLPQLFLARPSANFIISIPELLEFEHAEEITCSKIHQDLLKRHLSPQEALQLSWRIFEEAIDACGPSRVICSAILSADRILAYIMSHPKLSQSKVSEQAVILLLKMFHDVVPKWNFVQPSPNIVVAGGSMSGGGGGGGGGGGLMKMVENVFHVMIQFFTGGSGRRVLQILDGASGDPDAYVLGERWRNGSHPFALMSLRKIYHGNSSNKTKVSTGHQHDENSVNFRAFLDLVE